MLIGGWVVLRSLAAAGAEPGEPAGALPALRPPAVPLVVSDPYLSVWSFNDRSTDADTRHWTEKPHTLPSLVRIDGKPHRVLGAQPADVPALEQTGLKVLRRAPSTDSRVAACG